MSLKDALHWRYAPKRMTGEIVHNDKVNAILQAAQFAPTSMGLQPFKILLISNTELKEKIKPLAYNQPQITESSHLLIFAAYTKLKMEQIENYINNISTTRKVSTESLNDFKNAMVGFANSNSEENIIKWASNQTYISIGFALAEAALLGVDATPMEGFNTEQINTLFELNDKGFTSVAMIALGYRDSQADFLANAKKVRRPLDLLVEYYH
jgi:nitroreductase/dihydropteridine reductase